MKYMENYRRKINGLDAVAANWRPPILGIKKRNS